MFITLEQSLMALPITIKDASDIYKISENYLKLYVKGNSKFRTKTVLANFTTDKYGNSVLEIYRSINWTNCSNYQRAAKIHDYITTSNNLSVYQWQGRISSYGSCSNYFIVGSWAVSNNWRQTWSNNYRSFQAGTFSIYSIGGKVVNSYSSGIHKFKNKQGLYFMTKDIKKKL